MANPASFDNASLDSFTLRNFKSTALGHKTVVFHDKDNIGGMCLGNDANAGGVAGVLEDTGIDTSTGLPSATLPQNQTGRVRFAGITKVRTGAVAILYGEKVYIVAATGKATNVSTSNTFIGIALNTTAGAADELVVVRLALHGS